MVGLSKVGCVAGGGVDGWWKVWRVVWGGVGCVVGWYLQ